MKAKRVGYDIQTTEYKNQYGEDRARHELYYIYKDEEGVIIPNILTIYINLTKKIQKIIKTGRVGCVQHEY